jgi:hypothetical protein
MSVFCLSACPQSASFEELVMNECGLNTASMDKLGR